MQKLKIYEFNEVNSTNEFLAYNSDAPPVLCIAKKQTHGKGQHGRIWKNQQKNALFSIKLGYQLTTSLSGLSLMIGLCIINVLLNSYNIKDLSIKWPNDIYKGNKKLAGILIENTIKSNTYNCIIGIGINIISSEEVASINLDIFPKTLILEIMQKIFEYNALFVSKGFGVFMSEWKKYDYLKHYQKIIRYNGNTYHSQGVTSEGQLILANAKHKQVISSSIHMQVL